VLLGGERQLFEPAQLPRRVAYCAVRVTKGSGINLVVYEWAQNRMTQLTFLRGQVAATPTWTPDAKPAVFRVDGLFCDIGARLG
jgi:hypothetical protein